MYKALLIGCGNIGALYDFDTDDVLTHAKAYHENPDFTFEVYDINALNAKKVADKYGVKVIPDLDNCNFDQFDCISICSPTNTHFDLLKKAILSNTKVVICEKPITIDKNKLQELITLHKNSSTRILVNYIRRFAPAFADLKAEILEINKTDTLTNIAIRYQRGFLNNCSHALDLLQFIFNRDIDLTDLISFNKINDHFTNDPTLSVMAHWGNVNVNILGLGNVGFSHFEIDIYFKNHKIEIKDAGNTITLLNTINLGLNLPSLKMVYQRRDCLNNYMVPVINVAKQFLTDKGGNDNFNSAATLNLKMLNYLEQ